MVAYYLSFMDTMHTIAASCCRSILCGSVNIDVVLISNYMGSVKTSWTEVYTVTQKRLLCLCP